MFETLSDRLEGIFGRLRSRGRLSDEDVDGALREIRTALLGHCPMPALPTEHRPAAQVLAHLEAAFPDALCPIAAFQHTLRTFFV